jgi:bifunctional non-homologous end joining protein LigD
MRKLRAVLIEDETMFRQLILLTLGKVKDLQVIGEFGLGKPGLDFCLREKPDMLVFDLDPAPDVEWKVVVEATTVVGEYLRTHKLTPFVKTSGGKGFHVVVPIKPGTVSWDGFKAFAKHVAEDLDSLVPGRFVTVMTKSKRKGRIFIDYLRNGRGATSLAPYSARARKGAPVSCPVTWDELGTLSSADERTVMNVQEWLPTAESDPWKGFEKASGSW